MVWIVSGLVPDRIQSVPNAAPKRCIWWPRSLVLVRSGTKLMVTWRKTILFWARFRTYFLKSACKLRRRTHSFLHLLQIFVRLRNLHAKFRKYVRKRAQNKRAVRSVAINLVPDLTKTKDRGHHMHRGASFGHALDTFQKRSGYNLDQSPLASFS